MLYTTFQIIIGVVRCEVQIKLNNQSSPTDSTNYCCFTQSTLHLQRCTYHWQF